MAYGACGPCGCAFEENGCTPYSCGLAVPTKSAKPAKPGKKIPMLPGDWVRVRRGHRLEGAAGHVRKVDRVANPALVVFRQLNGTEVRLPLGLIEFVGYSGTEPDVL